jgi:hypothetical protein
LFELLVFTHSDLALVLSKGWLPQHPFFYPSPF